VLRVIDLILPVHHLISNGQRALAALWHDEVRIARIAVRLVLVLDMRTILEDHIAALASETLLMEGLAHRVGNLSENHLGTGGTRRSCRDDLSAIGSILGHLDFNTFSHCGLFLVRPCGTRTSRNDTTAASSSLCECGAWTRADTALCECGAWTRADSSTATDTATGALRRAHGGLRRRSRDRSLRNLRGANRTGVHAHAIALERVQEAIKCIETRGTRAGRQFNVDRLLINNRLS